MSMPSDEEVFDMVEGLRDRLVSDARIEAVERVAQGLGVSPYAVERAHARVDAR